MIFTRHDILKEFNGDQSGGEGRDMIKYMHQNFNPEVWHPVINELQTGFEKISRNANTKLMWLSLTIHIKNLLASYRYQHINT